MVECFIQNDLPTPKGIKGHQTSKWLLCMLTWLVLALNSFVRQTECLANIGTLAKLYRLDAFANSDTEFDRSVPTLAGSSTVEELNSNPDTFSLQ